MYNNDNRIPKLKDKRAAAEFCIMACKRQFGFAPTNREIKIDSYGQHRILFTVCGRSYIMKMYHAVPYVMLIDSVITERANLMTVD